MSDRIIFHADCNNFYASCEILQQPELKDVPMAVAGDPENRVGVVVAKNELAKRAGVKTTDTVYQAQRKCPGIVFVPPRHHFYSEISKRVNTIYLEYTDHVEPASIDESYIDMTEAAPALHMELRDLADELRHRVHDEIGITISVGVSFCKIFAKMGSDYKKPDATTVITRDNYKDILWPLPVGDLYMAGKAAVATMEKHYIRTIGDLAQQSQETMRGMLGKHGDLLWRYANGIDEETVRRYGDKPEIKSVSRGRTFKRDLVTEAEIRTAISVLADEVARALRKSNMKGEVVSVQIRRPDMVDTSRQTSLGHYTFLQLEIQEVAMGLIRENWRIGAPIRALTVGVSKLVPKDQVVEQMSLFDYASPAAGQEKRSSAAREKRSSAAREKRSSAAREKQEKLESLVDELREKHGEGSITLGYHENKEIGLERK